MSLKKGGGGLNIRTYISIFILIQKRHPLFSAKVKTLFNVKFPAPEDEHKQSFLLHLFVSPIEIMDIFIINPRHKIINIST